MTELDILKARVAELEAALMPFANTLRILQAWGRADEAQLIIPLPYDPGDLVQLTVADFKRALDAMPPLTEANSDGFLGFPSIDKPST